MKISKIACSAESPIGKTFPKFVNLYNFDTFPNRKNSENLIIFQIVNFSKIVNFLITKIS